MTSNPEKYVKPFIGLIPYNEDYSDFFFGRDEENKKAYDILNRNNLLFIYGFSGVGKSSIINCGLHKVFEEYEWMPIVVRRTKDYNINDSIINSLKYRLKNDFNTESESNDLLELIKSIYILCFKPIYLIFDQLEELYIVDPKVEEQQKFYENINLLLNSDSSVKIILSMREEYIGYIDPLEKLLPQYFHEKLRIEGADESKLTDILDKINNVENSIIKFKSNTEYKEIYDLLKDSDKNNIILPYLQLLLQKFAEDINQSDPPYPVIDCKFLEKYKPLENLIGKFLDDQIKVATCNLFNIDAPAERIIAESFIWNALRQFITFDSGKLEDSKKPFEGSKKPININQILKNISENKALLEIYKKIPEKENSTQNPDDSVDLQIETKSTPNQEWKILINAFIEEMINRRIINQIYYTKYYELMHDALAKHIYEKTKIDGIDSNIFLAQRIIRKQFELHRQFSEYNSTIKKKDTKHKSIFLNAEQLKHIFQTERDITTGIQFSSENEKMQLINTKLGIGEDERKWIRGSSDKIRKERIIVYALPLLILAICSLVSWRIIECANDDAKIAKNNELIANKEKRNAEDSLDNVKKSIIIANDSLRIVRDQVGSIKNFNLVERIFTVLYIESNSIKSLGEQMNYSDTIRIIQFLNAIYSPSYNNLRKIENFNDLKINKEAINSILIDELKKILDDQEIIKSLPEYIKNIRKEKTND